jgi:hypothetical protein
LQLSGLACLILVVLTHVVALVTGAFLRFALPLRLQEPSARKTTVEESLVPSASVLVRQRALVPGARTAGSWSWAYDGDDRPHATIGYEADLTDESNACSGFITKRTESRWTTGSGW